MDKVTVDKAYSSEPWYYDLRGFFILTFAYRSTLFSQIRLFAKNMGANHLEIAIGSGTLFSYILKWRKWKGLPETVVTGFDYADQMLAGARARFSKQKSVTLVKADAADLPFESNSFETANIANAIHCLPDIATSLRETQRVLKPGGYLAGNCLLYPEGSSLAAKLATRINNWGTRKGILNRPYRVEEVRFLLKNAGFVIDYEEIKGNCYDFVAKKIDA